MCDTPAPLRCDNLVAIVLSHDSRSLCLSFPCFSFYTSPSPSFLVRLYSILLPFSLLFFLYFFYLASLSTSLLPRYLFYIDPYLAIFFIPLLPCLSRIPEEKITYNSISCSSDDAVRNLERYISGQG